MQDVGRVHTCQQCHNHVHIFCGIDIDEESFGQKVKGTWITNNITGWNNFIPAKDYWTSIIKLQNLELLIIFRKISKDLSSFLNKQERESTEAGKWGEDYILHI